MLSFISLIISNNFEFEEITKDKIKSHQIGLYLLAFFIASIFNLSCANFFRRLTMCFCLLWHVLNDHLLLNSHTWFTIAARNAFQQPIGKISSGQFFIENTHFLPPFHFVRQIFTSFSMKTKIIDKSPRIIRLFPYSFVSIMVLKSRSASLNGEKSREEKKPRELEFFCWVLSSTDVIKLQ